jgi:hypothetical protein
MSHRSRGSSRAVKIAACLAGLMMFSSSQVLAEADRDERTVANCVSFDQSPTDQGMEYRMENTCQRRVTCTVSWTVYCGDAPPLKRIPGRSVAVVAPTKQATITATAASCNQAEGWHIADSRWECAS